MGHFMSLAVSRCEELVDRPLRGRGVPAPHRGSASSVDQRRSRCHCQAHLRSAYDRRGKEQLYFPLPEVPYLKLAAVHDDEGGTLTLFALNRHLDETMTLAVDARSFDGMSLREAHSLHHDDLGAVNTKDAPDRVKPTELAGIDIDGTRLSATLPPASWNAIRLEVGG